MDPLSLPRVLTRAHAFFNRAYAVFGPANDWHRTAYLCVLGPSVPRPLALSRLGPTSQAAQACAQVAQANAVRLFTHPLHRTSWESASPSCSNVRDLAHEPDPGGAVRTPGRHPWIISCSGIKQDWDEALALIVAIHAAGLRYPDAVAMAHESTRLPLFALNAHALFTTPLRWDAPTG